MTKTTPRTRPIEDGEELFEHLPHYEGATFGETPKRFLDRENPKPTRDRK